MKGRLILELTKRLMKVASFVRDGAFLIDVGTDHAYLPIHLTECGKVRAAIASDINEGPCESARIHIAERGLSCKISVKRANGLCGHVAKEKTDIVIAGMGGALICEILENADFIKNTDIRLILQPMRNVPDLRRYLLENGFNIIGEALACEEERIYEIICASYDGEKRNINALSLILGDKNIENKYEDKELFCAFCEKQAASLTKKINGMKKGNADVSAQQELLEKINEQMNF